MKKEDFWLLKSPEGRLFRAIPEEVWKEHFSDTKAEKVTLGQALRIERQRKGITQGLLEKISGVSQGQLSRIEKMKSGDRYGDTREKLLGFVRSYKK
jgi:hypothetical protein